MEYVQILQRDLFVLWTDLARCSILLATDRLWLIYVLFIGKYCIVSYEEMVEVPWDQQNLPNFKELFCSSDVIKLFSVSPFV